MRSTQAVEADEAAGAASAADRREHQRKPVLWAARVETAAGSAECIILDLSLGGAKLRVATKAAPQERVTLFIDRFGALGGEIAWVRPSHMGIRFTDTPERIAQILGTSLPLAR